MDRPAEEDPGEEGVATARRGDMVGETEAAMVGETEVAMVVEVEEVTVVKEDMGEVDMEVGKVMVALAMVGETEGASEAVEDTILTE